MLTPRQLQEIADTMYPILDELNTWITSDVIKRLMARLGRGEGAFFTETDKWQLELYKEAAGHYEALEREIRRWTKKADAEVKAIFEDAGLKAWKADDAFYTKQGYESIPLLKSETLMRMLTDAYQRTQGEIHNFTRTTAEHSQQRFIKVCDSAHFRVMTGAQGYTQAVRDAVEELADAGQLRVKYPTGYSDTIETAVLRCVRTGAAQASGSLAIQGMLEHDWDIILVSAHLGARYGDGGENPGNHFWWQGKFYSRTGKTPELPLFKETGYGTGEGLSGWNCRHSFGPGNLGYNPYEKYDTEENRAAYDLSQKQRAMEARIRRMKTKLLGYKKSIENCDDPKTKKGLQADYDRLAQKLSARNNAYNEFCENNNLRPYNDRLQVAKWNRAEATRAAKAAARADKAVANSENSDIIKLYRGNERRTANLGAFATLQIPMQKREVLRVAAKYGVSVKGITVKIQRNEKLLALSLYGSTDYKRVGRIDLFPKAFQNEEQLIRTLLHEKCHVKQIIRHGADFVQDNISEMERQAYRFEEIWYSFLKKRR